MTHRDFALLLSPLPLSPLLLALAACGSEYERADRSQREMSSPFGFEIAMAGTASANDMGAAAQALTRQERAVRIPAGNVGPIDQRTGGELAVGGILAGERARQPIDDR